MEDILHNLRQQIQETRELMQPCGVEPHYIVMGKYFHNTFQKSMIMSVYINGRKKYIEVTHFEGLKIIIDDIQPNVVYILDFENGKRIYEYQERLKSSYNKEVKEE